MDFLSAVAILNRLLLRKRPDVISSSWILKHAPACYRFIRKTIRNEVGKIDWDRVTYSLASEYQRCWKPRSRKKCRPYKNSHEIKIILEKYRSKLYVFIAPVDLADRRIRDK